MSVIEVERVPAVVVAVLSAVVVLVAVAEFVVAFPPAAVASAPPAGAVPAAVEFAALAAVIGPGVPAAWPAQTIHCVEEQYSTALQALGLWFVHGDQQQEG